MNIQNQDDICDNFIPLNNMEKQAVQYQPLDEWLARVSDKQQPPPPVKAEHKQPIPSINTALSAELGTPSIMMSNQLTVKVDRLALKHNELETQFYYLQEDVKELKDKKHQLNQEIACLTNSKSAIKTINQRLNGIEVSISNLLDRIEVLEKKESLDTARRFASSAPVTNNNNKAPSEFAAASDSDENELPPFGPFMSDPKFNYPGHPFAVLNSSANRRGRKKRRALDQGDHQIAVRSTVGSDEVTIAKVEELVASVVQKLSMLKMAVNTDRETEATGTTASLNAFATAGCDDARMSALDDEGKSIQL